MRQVCCGLYTFLCVFVITTPPITCTTSRVQSEIHMSASDQTRNSPCGNPFAKQFVTSIAQHHLCQSGVSPTMCANFVVCGRAVMCVRVCFVSACQHDAWVSRDVCALSLRVSPDARVFYCLRVSHDVCVSVFVSITMCMFLLSAGESCWVCCVLAAGEASCACFVCLGVHHDLSVFGGKGKEHQCVSPRDPPRTQMSTT